jgi:predicted ATPase
MELLYIWIEDFRNIRKQGFDFSAEFKFKMEELEKVNSNYPLSYKLAITRNENYVNLFHGNIINITGIIGKNGSGKSTLLHCLKMMTGKLSILVCPLIFCLRDNESGTIKTYFYNGGGDTDMIPLNLLVEADREVKRQYKVVPPKAYTIDRFGIEGSKVKGLDFDFYSIASCYFSNTFDSHREIIYEGIHNISTNYKIESFLKDYIDTKEKAVQRKKKDVPIIELWPSHILQFHKSELKGLLKFLSYANTRKTSQLPILPKTLIIEFKFDDYENLISEGKASFLFDKKDIEEIQKSAVAIANQSNDKRKNFMNMVLLTSFYHVLRKELLQPEITSMDECRALIKTLPNNPNELFATIRKILAPLSKLKDDSLESKTIIEFLGKSFENAVQRIQFSDTENVSDNKAHYRLKIENNLWSVLSLIFDLQALDDANYMDYSWGGGLSTGQEAFLTHFARLNDLKNKLGSKPIWLMIDEGDLYFHPEWQKRYFSELLDYVKFLFPRNKVQIIITTHSPFIASDLPKQNLIFLKQDAEGMCSVANNEMQFETFGSNIHELFTNSFFLADGLMGEFARTSISDLIKELNSVERISGEEYEDKYKKRIEIIGESFIQAKLYELVASKTDNNVIDSIIETRNTEIERLRNLKNRNRND